jgi:hypothetical protein
VQSIDFHATRRRQIEPVAMKETAENAARCRHAHYTRSFDAFMMLELLAEPA